MGNKRFLLAIVISLACIMLVLGALWCIYLTLPTQIIYTTISNGDSGVITYGENTVPSYDFEPINFTTFLRQFFFGNLENLKRLFVAGNTVPY